MFRGRAYTLMKLRLILLVLSLLAFLSASVGGYIYYHSLREAAFKEAERQAAGRVVGIEKNLSSYLSRHVMPAKAMAGLPEMRDVLVSLDERSLAGANRVLDYYNHVFETEVCYLMSGGGHTIASSNRNFPDSFVGKNFGFRPYFKEAMDGMPSAYLALGTTSGKRGAYFSHPIFFQEGDGPVGVVVVKASVEQIENELPVSNEEIVFVVDPDGIVFISSRKAWLYRSVDELSEEQVSRIARCQQFGAGPWETIALKPLDGPYVEDDSGRRYLIHRVPLANFKGWRVVHMQNLDSVARRVSEPLWRTTGPIVASLCLLVGLGVLFLYSGASREIKRRKEVEKALRDSEERYRFIYHNTPAMLHSVDPTANLVRVSDHWLAALGYEREEVIGHKLFEFLTPESARFVKEHVIREFFKTGRCQDIPYQFVKKDGEIMEILLSAIGERDESGEVIRSLAVSIDVTQRNRAERELKEAKEQLSRYSRDLERQVRKRTEEIANFLKYTPGVVSLKDRDGRYLLVNKRFEDLFNVKIENIRGKKDFDIHDRDLADQFRANDLRVLAEKRSCQVEEQVPQSDGVHTYLSVKFPILDEQGEPTGVGTIATDITSTKKARDRLRRLSGSIMAGQENERAAIARELHDELGQTLTVLNMDAAWLAKRLVEKDPQAAGRAEDMRKFIDETIDAVRGMALRLRPKVLDDLGLVDALEWLTSDFEKRTEINCIFHVEDVPVIHGPVATAAYRIVQEALTNVARHSFANQVRVELSAQEGTLSLLIEDNGRGFNALDMSEFSGLGIAGMRERATIVGGILDVRSQPEHGTRISFKVPLEGKENIAK